MGFDTAANIISDAALELALVTSAVADPWASNTDANVALLRQLLKSVGRDLSRRHRWTQLQALYVLTTAANQPFYGLPADYDRYIDQSGWNRSTRLPLSGISPVQWEILQGQLSGVVLNTLIRQLQGNLLVYPGTSVTSGLLIAFEYMSSFWVRPSAVPSSVVQWMPSQAYSLNNYVSNGGNLYQCTTAGTASTSGPTATSGTQTDGTVVWTYVSASGASAPSAKDDTILLESNMVQSALQLAWRKKKRMDASAEEVAADDAFEQAVSMDSPAEVLRLARNEKVSLLGLQNLPVTGWGK